MTRIVVDNRVRLPEWGEIPDEVTRELCALFEHRNPTAGKNRYRKNEPEKIGTWTRDEDGSLTFPRGGLRRVVEFLFAHGVGHEIVDETTWDHPEPDFPDHKVEARDYQRDMVEAAEQEKTCALRAPCGSGKTTAALALVARMKRRALVVVTSTALVKQWRDRAVDELGMKPAEVGIVGGRRRDKVRPLTIAMQQTLASRFKRGDYSLADQFDLVVCDELQLFAAPTLYLAVDPFTARMRVGISADETRKDEKEFLIYDLFGPVAHQVPEERLIADGSIVEVEVAVVPTEFEAPWYRFRQDFTRLVREMGEDEERNAIAIKLARKAVESGEQVLVFVHRVEHARKLAAKLAGLGIAPGLFLGGPENETEFDRAKAAIKRGTLRAAVGTYKAIRQAVDLPTVARGVAVTPIAANRQDLNQLRGRLCRASSGKESGRLAVLWDRHVYGRKTISRLVEWQRVVRVWDGESWVDGREFLKPAGERKKTMRKRGEAAVSATMPLQVAGAVVPASNVVPLQAAPAAAPQGMNIQQTFKGHDPDAVAQAFRRDVVAHAEAREAAAVQSAGFQQFAAAQDAKEQARGTSPDVLVKGAGGAPVTNIVNNPMPANGLDELETIKVVWGREYFQPMQFNGFDVGPFECTVTAPPHELFERAARAYGELEAFARKVRAQKLASYVEVLRQVGQAAGGFR